MKKTFTINISGIIFNIDDDAYEKLNHYLEHIKQHFRNTEGKDEIINDIESRIAEILQDKLGDDKQVVSMADINEVIEMMGQPSEFDESETEEGSADTDAEKSQSYTTYKRLYRDPDNRIIGGVSAGIGAYFKIDPLWIRLLFIILTLFPGFGIFIYIILWIVVPEARTTAERLAMRGEPVNISTIEKSIKEEFDNLKDKINDLADDAKRSFKKKSKEYPRTSDPIASFLGSFFRILGRIFLIFIGFIFLVIGLSFLVSLVALIAGAGTFYLNDDIRFMMFPSQDLLYLLFDDTSNIPIIKITLLLAVGIPFLMLAVLAVRMIFGLNRSRFFYPVAFNVWIISIIILTVFSFRLARDFRTEEQLLDRETMSLQENTELVINLLEPNPGKKKATIIHGDDWIIVDESDRLSAYGEPELIVEPSPDSLLHIDIERLARGNNVEVALERAKGIHYLYQLDDTLLSFDRYFSLANPGVWRKQEVNVILQVPVGRKITFDQRMYRILGFHKNYSRHSISGNTFYMTRDGLKSVTEGYSSKKESTSWLHQIMVGMVNLLPGI